MALAATQFDYGKQDADLFEPIGDRYLCEALDFGKEYKSNGGIIIPLTHLDPMKVGWKPGRVVRVGDGHRLENNETIPMKFEVGDFIMVERMAGREIELQGRKYFVVSQAECLGRFK